MQQLSRFILMASLILTSCNNIDDFIPFEKANTIQTEPPLYNKGLAELQLTPLVLEFNSGEAFEYVFDDLSKINIPANIFAYDGKPLPNKKIQLKVTRVKNKSDMSKMGLTTYSKGRLISSGGMFYLEATWEGKPLNLIVGKHYELRIAEPNPIEEMELFYGEVNKETPLDWIEADNNPNSTSNVGTGEWRAGNLATYGYVCFPERLKWINCDYFVNFTGTFVTPCVQVLSDPKNDSISTNIFCVFKNFNAITSVSLAATAANMYCFNKVPAEQEVTYIVIGKGKKDYYIGQVRSKTAAGGAIDVKIEPASLEEVKLILNKL